MKITSEVVFKVVKIYVFLIKKYRYYRESTLNMQGIFNLHVRNRDGNLKMKNVRKT